MVFHGPQPRARDLLMWLLAAGATPYQLSTLTTNAQLLCYQSVLSMSVLGIEPRASALVVMHYHTQFPKAISIYKRIKDLQPRNSKVLIISWMVFLYS